MLCHINKKKEKRKKIFKQHGKWQHKKHFCYFLINKIVATVLLASLTALLWFSENSTSGTTLKLLKHVSMYQT